MSFTPGRTQIGSHSMWEAGGSQPQGDVTVHKTHHHHHTNNLINCNP